MVIAAAMAIGFFFGLAVGCFWMTMYMFCYPQEEE